MNEQNIEAHASEKARRAFWGAMHFDGLVKHCRAVIGDEYLGLFIARRLARAIGRTKDQCISHVRLCDASDAEGLEEYRETQEAGCCGSFDGEVTHYKTGRRFLFGFNYGH